MTNPVDDAEAVVLEHVEAFNAHAVERFVALHAEGVEFFNRDGSIRLSGLDALRAFYEKLFLERPTIHAEVIGKIVEGDRVVLHERITDRGQLMHHSLVLYLVEDGKIRRTRFL